ncbi:MAG: rhomboid family intramembrane serine protease [Planctomycetes bacterium]|nr:rhomboid family intramembrane serine protease [Planctomycetota bacterium]
MGLADRDYFRPEWGYEREYHFSIRGRMTPGVTILLAVLVAFSFIQLGMVQGGKEQFVLDNFYFSRGAIVDRGAFWTVLTSFLIPGSTFLHSTFCLVVIWLFGRRLEEEVGTFTFLFAFFLSGILGCGVELLLAPDAVSAGFLAPAIMVCFLFSLKFKQMKAFDGIGAKWFSFVSGLLLIAPVFPIIEREGSYSFKWAWIAPLAISLAIFGFERIRLLSERKPAGSTLFRTNETFAKKKSGQRPGVPDSLPENLDSYHPHVQMAASEAPKMFASPHEAELRDKINSLLDKMNSLGGYDALTEEERTFLKEASRRLSSKH